MRVKNCGVAFMLGLAHKLTMCLVNGLVVAICGQKGCDSPTGGFVPIRLTRTRMQA